MELIKDQRREPKGRRTCQEGIAVSWIWEEETVQQPQELKDAMGFSNKKAL